MLKKLRRQLSRKSVTLAWLLSYTTIVMIPFCLCFFCVYRYSATMEKQTRQLNEYISYTITNNVKETILGMKMMYQQLYFDKNIEELGTVKRYEDYFRRGEYYAVLEQLQQIKRYSSNIDIFFVYYPDTDCVLSADGLLKSRDYYNLFFSDCQTDYESWKNGIQIPRKFKKFKVNNNKMYSDIMYSDTMYANNAVIVILSQTNRFFNGIVSDMLENYSVYVFDSDKNVVNYISEQSNEEQNNEILYEDIIDKSQNRKYEITDNVVQFDMDTMNIVTLTPKKILFRNLNNLKYITILMFVISIMISVFQIVWFLRKNYRPIYHILKKMHISEETKDNEFALISSKIESVMSDWKRLDSLYLNQIDEMRRLSLEKIIHNGYIDYTTQKRLGENNISFEGASFILEVFSPEGGARLFENRQLNESEKRKEIYFIVDNVIKELLGINGIACYLTEIDDKIACLLCFPDDCTEDEREVMRERTDKGFRFISEQFDITIEYVVSNVFYSIGNISRIYREITREMSCQHLYNINCGGDILAEKAALEEAVKEKNVIEAKHIVAEIFDRLEGNGADSDAVKMIIEYIFEGITDHMGTMKSPEDSDEKLMSVYECNTVTEIKRCIDKLISILCSNIGMDVYTKTASICRMTEQYINENYSDVNLNISNVAAHFNISPTYLSGQFKEYTGKKIIDFINEVRLSKAKEMMSEGRYTMAVIAKMSGFGHVRTFNRVFKKYEGITPSEYMKKNF